MSGGFSMRLADIARSLEARPLETDAVLTGVSTDTRSLKAGELLGLM